MADNYPMDLPLALGRRWRVAHNSTGSTTTNKAFERRGSWAGSMRQQEHFDEATAACWVTFCSEAIRPLTLFAAPQCRQPPESGGHPVAPSRGVGSCFSVVRLTNSSIVLVQLVAFHLIDTTACPLARHSRHT